MKWVLMCAPDYFGIEYEINPWMRRHCGVDVDRARRQWSELHREIVNAGARVDLLKPEAGHPDLVFTANAGLVYHKVFFVSNFRYPERSGESPLFERWFAQHGFTLERMPEGVFFEGAGDALFCSSILYAGYKTRSDIVAHQLVAARLGVPVLPLELIHPAFYHLDTCFCPIKPGLAMYYPGAFDTYGIQVLKAHIPGLVEVDETEAKRFACNAVVLGQTIILNKGCPKIEEELRKLKFETRAVELDEFLKSGGSAKCLTFRVDGEDAAVWN